MVTCLQCGSDGPDLRRENWGAEYCAICVECTFEQCDWCKRPWPADLLDPGPHGHYCPPCYSDAVSFYDDLAREEAGVDLDEDDW